MSLPSPVSPLYVYGLLVIVGFIGALGDATINEWARTSRLWWWLVSIPIWIAAATLFGYVLHWQYFNFSLAVVVALLVHSGAVLLFDRTILGARFSALQWVGVVLALLALVLLELGRSNASSPSQ